MTLAHVFKRPGVYFGTDFKTIDEFCIFMNTMSCLGDREMLPPEEVTAVRSYHEFACRHLHGYYKDCSWRYELLARSRDHESAVESAMLLYLDFVELLREKGTGQLREIMEQAASLELMGGARGRDRLVKLREAAISRDIEDEPPLDVARLLGPEFLNVRDQPGLVAEAPQG